MTYLVAAIEHHARKLANAVTRAVVEKCSGFSDYEAGDHLQHVHADMLADAEAEYEVAEPARYSIEECFRLLNQSYDECGGCGYMRREHGQLYGALYSGACSAFVEPQTPVAGQRGESSPTASEPPELAVGLSDPSRVTVGAVRGEGSPADSDIPSSPAGERPTWVDWAVPAICDVLAVHVPAEGMLGNIHCGHYVWDESADDTTWASCGQFADETDWREHVAPLIAERLYLASKPPLLADWPETGLDMGARIDGASEFFPQHRTTQK